MYLSAERDQESVSAKLDVVTHHCRIHPNDFDWEGINDKFHFNVTALLMMSMTRVLGRRSISLEQRKEVKSQWSPSS